MEIAVDLHGIGQSPATAVNVLARLMFLTTDTVEWDSVQAELCEPIRRVDRQTVGFTLFPGQVVEKRQFLHAPSEEVAKARTFLHGPLTDHVVAVIAGCVDYRFTFAKGHHQTPFIYHLASLADPKNRVSFKVTPEINAELEPYISEHGPD